MGDLCSICGDVGKLAGNIDLFLRKELKNCQQTAKSIEQTFEIEKSKYLLDLQRVKYVQELLTLINQNLLNSEQPAFICPPIPEKLSIQNTSTQKSKLPQNFPSFTVSRKNILAGLGFIAVLAVLFMASKNTIPSIPEPSTLRPSTTVTQKINPTQGLPSKPSTEDAAYLNARTDLSLNGMDLGISIAEAEKILGRPSRIKKVDGYDRYIYSDKFYIAVIDGKVNAFVTEDPKFKTRRGIHVGSTYSKVIDAYGTDSKDMYADNLTLREYPFTSLDGKESLLRFAINSSGRVDYISIRIVDR